MTHLVANYPDPTSFEQALLAMFEVEVDFLEIQLPFSNPLADGLLIYEANQKALQYGKTLEQILKNVHKIYSQKSRKTKLLLMSYLTPILALGLENVVNLCHPSNFVGFIIPDLIFGSYEHQIFSQHCKQNQMQVIPVISPLTKSERLEKIKLELKPNQVIYAMARAGRTGNQTDLEQIQPYLDFLKQNLHDYQLAVGFGIREKSQVQFLNQQSFFAVIGSEIIRQIQIAEENKIDIYQQITHYLQALN
jgi:tryptophan synthase alpha chain